MRDAHGDKSQKKGNGNGHQSLVKTGNKAAGEPATLPPQPIATAPATAPAPAVAAAVVAPVPKVSPKVIVSGSPVVKASPSAIIRSPIGNSPAT